MPKFSRKLAAKPNAECGTRNAGSTPFPHSAFRIRLAASDEVNDLDPVGIFDSDVGPIFLSHNFAIQFDRYSLKKQRKKLEKPVQADLASELFNLAIKSDLHPI